MNENMLKNFSLIAGVDCTVFDVRLKKFEDVTKTFCNRCPRRCDYINTHLYGCYESVRWDNRYIYYCPLDLIFIAIPIKDEFNILGSGIIIGPMQMGELEDFEKVPTVPDMHTARVNALAEVGATLFCDSAPSGTKQDVGDFLNAIYKELELLPKRKEYPLSLEKNLQQAILAGDEKKAKECLNRLLGEIFLQSNAELNVIKARALELLVLLSRSAIDGGADVEQIFALNNNFIDEIDNIKTTEQLAAWMSNIINRFVGYVFDFKDVRHSAVIRKIVGYIRSNYMNKISLDAISEYVYMSKSYISKIFNEEMGMNISSYINKIRIEKSKHLLIDASLSIVEVANLAGFEDQSYFSKQFKNETGISPKIFREKNGIEG